MIKLSFQRKIFWYFTLVVLLIGVLVILVCRLHIFHVVLNETKSRVAIDLQVAHNFLDKEIEKLVITLDLLAEKQRLIDPLEKSQPISSDIRSWLEKKRVDSGFDFLTLCDRKGKVILRTRFPHYSGDFSLSNSLVSKAFRGEKCIRYCNNASSDSEDGGRGSISASIYSIYSYSWSQTSFRKSRNVRDGPHGCCACVGRK